ncbi:MFS transporter, DHA1 family, tetracycline resistance protein [Pseudooceanicola antarcticus]|uniref:MFS transporter n=1 Tax=Pseudooceanicola antarcticus TaxID=1247613 RepID=A0A285IEZ8_9RHOB|nr:MFS transporter [Pseudooceanicola antarcticus]PJE29132.1 MFS transporter [Pseudooceanicola antarcticus]SNY46560.1 MFS transporter, DHA1 family, tetracycline resistance protein [Pseudooceanicola antarcticus]
MTINADPQQAASRLPRLIILLTVVIEAMGVGVIFPVMPDLLREILDATLSEAAIWGGVLITAFAATQFLCGPLIGNLSDAYGRRRVVLIALAVMALDYVIMALAQNIWLLFAGRLVAGATAAVVATASAYMADISKGSDKARNFGLVQACFGMGFVLGPALGGLVAGLGVRAPFWAAALLCVFNFSMAFLILPESLRPEARRAFRWRRANPLGALLAASKLPGLKPLLLAYLLYLIGLHVYGVIWAYFTQAQFGWEVTLVGLSLTIYGVALAVVQAVLFGPIYRRLGPRTTVLAGLWINTFFFAWLTVIKNGTLTLVMTPFTALGEISQPAMSAIASDAAPEDAQGELQGVLSSLQAVAMIFTPMLMTTIFRIFTAEDAPVYLPGAPFGASALLMLPAMVLIALYLPRRSTAAGS